MRKLSFDFAEDILDIIPGGIYVFQDGKFVFVNREVSRISGYSKDELLEMNPFDLIAGEEEKEEIIRNTERALEGKLHGLPSEQKVRIRCKDGEFKYVSLRPLPVIFEGKRAIMTTVVDITQEVLEREKRKRLEEYVRLTGKMLRHDVLNHLSAVTGYLELYRDFKDENHLKKATDSAESCIKTLKRLRELEWLIEEGREMRSVSVREVFESIHAGRDVRMVIRGNCRVQADDGIYSIAENLIANAVEHGESEEIVITIAKKEEWCEVRIADRGRGVPDELKTKIFEEGFSSAQEGRGTGLFIVKRLMEKYGGRVWVEDNMPSGSVFVLRFRVAL